MTNGNAKFTRIMINDSSSYSRVIRLTGKGTSDAAAFFEPWHIVIPEALNFRLNRRGSVTFNAFRNFIVYFASLNFFHPRHFHALDARTRGSRVLIRRLIPIHLLFTLVKFLIYILYRFRAYERQTTSKTRARQIEGVG